MRRRRESFDVVFYVPTVGELLASGRAGRAGGAETQVVLLARGWPPEGSRSACGRTTLPEG